MGVNFILHKEISRSSPKHRVEEVPGKSPRLLMVLQVRELPQQSTMGITTEY